MIPVGYLAQRFQRYVGIHKHRFSLFAQVIQDAQFAEEAWTPPPYVIDDSAYDDVTAVREYEEETPAPAEGE